MIHKKKWQMVYITSATSTTSLYNKPQISILKNKPWWFTVKIPELVGTNL